VEEVEAALVVRALQQMNILFMVKGQLLVAWVEMAAAGAQEVRLQELLDL
jgi:hypothetical protein